MEKYYIILQYSILYVLSYIPLIRGELLPKFFNFSNIVLD